MKKVLKITAVIVLIPVILFAVAAVGLATIDLNNYRSEIEQLVSENTGRQLTLKGDLQKSFFPWLGIEVGTVALSNAKGFKPDEFASIGKVEIKIDTVSLLKLEPKISRIIVKGLNLHLAKNKAGITNWADLSQASTSDQVKQPAVAAEDKAAVSKEDKPQASSTTDPLALINIAGITIENANVNWVDEQAGASYALKNVNLVSSEIKLNTPVALDMDFELVSATPQLNAKVILSSAKVDWDLKNQRFAVSPLSVDLQASGKALPVSPLSAKLQLVATTNLQKQLLTIDELKLDAFNLSLQGKVLVSQLMDAPRYQSDIAVATFSPRSVLKALSIPLPAMADEKAMTAASLKVNVKGDTTQVEVSDLQVQLDDTTLNANASVVNFSKPVIKATVELDTINLDRYLPPTVEADAAATPAAEQAPATTPAEPLPIPVELIRSLDADASVKAGKVIIKQLDIDELIVKAKVKNKVATLNPVSMNLAKGSLRTDLRLDVTKSTPLYTVKQTIDQVQAAPLVKAVAGDEHVSGMLMLKASVDSKGMMLDDVRKNLNGNLSFLFKDGAVKGVNLAEMLRKARAKLDKEEYVESNDHRQTDFAELGGSATINNGVVTNKDLSAKSPLLRVEGEGKVDLVKESLDYLVTTHLVGTSKGQGGKSMEELRGIPVPIRLTGPFNDIQWDYKWSVIRKAFQDKLKKKVKAETKAEVEAKKAEIKEKLEEKKEEKKEEIKEKLEDKFKEKLKKLF